jgi:hypothetical protein
VSGLLAVSLSIGSVLMIGLGIAGMVFGLRTLRPQVSDIEDYLRARSDPKPPSRWAGLFAGTSVIFALVALLIGILLFMFGLGLILLSP